MNRYTIYCTQAQAAKALELGAPIEYYLKGIFKVPTAEQMTGWLEEQGIFVEVSKSFIADYQSLVHDANTNVFYDEYFLSHKEAILAAIEAALDYLIKTKEEIK